ncbi:MAG: hypothetical protein IBX70_07800 [Clostridia bacterium]|nr:hypothetical protein [Clostridia bacterium]
MKKKVIIGVVLVFLFIVSIDLFIRKPWIHPSQTEEESVMDESSIVLQSNQDMTETESRAENTQPTGNEEEGIETPLTETPSFINQRNEYSALYSNGEFSDEILEISSEELGGKDIDALYDTLDKIYLFSIGELEIDSLIGLVDSVTLDDKYHPRFNGFVEQISEREEFAVFDSFRMSENVYKLKIMLQTPAGEGDEDYVLDTLVTTATYNTKYNRLSFEEIIQRTPTDFTYTSDQYTVHAYLLECDSLESKLYLEISTSLSDIIMIDDIPLFSAKAKMPNGNIEVIPFYLNYYGIPLVPNNDYYFVANIPTVIESIESLEMIKN